MKKCPNCSKDFEPNHGKQLFCSTNCRIANSRKKQTNLPTDTTEKPPTEFSKVKTVSEEPKPKHLFVQKNAELPVRQSAESAAQTIKINNEINERFGAGTIMTFGDKPNEGYDVISTGSLKLDSALGIGGLPRGRIVEIFGMESCGKSTITLHVIANAQKQGLKCLLVDAENSFDPEYANALGVIVDDLEYCQPSCGEDGLEVADMRISKGDIGVVIFDSVAAMIPKAELEAAMGESKMGLHARLMSQACRKLVGVVAHKNVLCIFINQIRMKIGVVYGSPEVVPGGLALQFFASMRLRVSRSTSKENSVMNGNIVEGNETTVKVIKNKCSPPFRSATFNIIYGKGVDRTGEIISIAIEKGIIKQAGSWFSYNEMKLGQGISSVIDSLNNHPDLVKEIENKIINN